MLGKSKGRNKRQGIRRKRKESAAERAGTGWGEKKKEIEKERNGGREDLASRSLEMGAEGVLSREKRRRTYVRRRHLQKMRFKKSERSHGRFDQSAPSGRATAISDPPLLLLLFFNRCCCCCGDGPLLRLLRTRRRQRGRGGSAEGGPTDREGRGVCFFVARFIFFYLSLSLCIF